MATKPRIQVKMEGSGLLPETVKAGDLAEFIHQFEVAVLAETSARSEHPIEPEEVIVSLVAIHTGSNELSFAVAPDAFLAAGAITEAISTHNYNKISYRSQEALYAIFKQASHHNWSIRIAPESVSDIQPGIISKEDPIPPPSVRTVKGQTTIWGRLIRVGGKRKPVAKLELSDGNYLYVVVSMDLARELGSRLYEDVSLDGEATWVTDDWTLVAFSAKHATGYSPHRKSITKVFKDLSEASKGRWDDIDPEEFVDRLRGRDKS